MVGWAPASADTQLLGDVPARETADLAVLEDAPELITQLPDEDRLGSPARVSCAQCCGVESGLKLVER